MAPQIDKGKAGRAAVEELKSSRRGFKSAATRVSGLAVNAIQEAQAADDAGDPTQLEMWIEQWETALNRYIEAENKVISHPFSEEQDADLDLGKAQALFIEHGAAVRGFRKDFDEAARLAARQPAAQPAAVVPQAQQAQGGNARPDLPKLVIEIPSPVQEDTDLIEWLRWRPTWDNYAMLQKLAQRDRETQVALFWQVCTPGFRRILHQTLGIPQETGRTLDDIFQAIVTHLRSLRNQQIDLRNLLTIRQHATQDYVSLCNEIKEHAEYADTRHITAELLHIGVLILAMRREDDRAKLINERPATFQAAREFILNLETARKASAQISRDASQSLSSTKVNRVTKSKYKANKEQKQLEGKGGGHSNAKPPPPAVTVSKQDSCGTVSMG